MPDYDADLDDGYSPALEDPVTSDEKVPLRDGERAPGRLVADGDVDEMGLGDNEPEELGRLVDDETGALPAEEAAIHIVDEATGDVIEEP